MSCEGGLQRDSDFETHWPELLGTLLDAESAGGGDATSPTLGKIPRTWTSNPQFHGPGIRFECRENVNPYL